MWPGSLSFNDGVVGSFNNSDKTFSVLTGVYGTRSTWARGQSPKMYSTSALFFGCQSRSHEASGITQILLHHLTLAFNSLSVPFHKEGPKVPACWFRIPKLPPRPGPPSCPEFAFGMLPNLKSYSSQQLNQAGLYWCWPCCACAHSWGPDANQGAGVVSGRGWSGAELHFGRCVDLCSGRWVTLLPVPKLAGGCWGDILLSLTGSVKLGSGSKCDDLGGFPELCSSGNSSAHAPRASLP